MTLATEMMWDANPSRRFSLPAACYDRAFALAAFVGAGVAVSIWSMATVATLHTVETSVVSASRILPESSLLPGTVALVDPLHRIAQMTRASASHIAATRFGHAAGSATPPPARLAADDGRSGRFASTVVEESKAARVVPALQSRLKKAEAPLETPLEHRFQKVVAEAGLTPEKRLAAFAHPAKAAADASRSGRLAFAAVDAASLPLREIPTPSEAPTGERFGGALPDRAPVPGREPAPSRTMPAVAEVERSARVALAVVGSAQSDDTDIPLPSLPAVAPAPSLDQLSGDARDESGTAAQDAFAEAMPDSAPLPAKRPEPDNGIPFKPSSQKPDTVLAYAKPDEPVERAQPKPSNKFALPGAGSGVAVYDIKAATVYMPNGERLEAHSGMGSYTDKPRYVDEKDRGPTPPNVYTLSMREKLFHGVPAIRLTPVGDKKMYGRVGFLAHTYMLRGHYAQSNGCVVFKDYQKFLRAFKRGKVTKLVVVPTLSGHSVSLFAEDDNRWNSFRSSRFNRGA
ncbi:MAG: DUF2778 domain-containing protein [Rhizobiaceae bacterium]|nr:MAG: DUF2778 domain-containing protein [Rhizobiaceae bacterium]